MEEVNAIQLTAIDPLQFKERRHNVSDDSENSSVAFRILNRHHRVRLSSKGIDYGNLPGKTNLIAVANQKGCIVTAVQQQDGFYLICSPLNELRNSVESGQPSSPPFISFQSRSSIKLPAAPCNIRVALNDERLLVGMLDGTILVYELDKLLLEQSQPTPLFTIPARSSNPVQTILPNLGDIPELVVILHSPSSEQGGHQIEIFNVKDQNTLVTWRRGSDPNLIPVSISWSPKGKQIAIGLQSGGFLLYNPHEPNVPKKYILKSPSISEDASSLLSISWIATNTFYLVFSSPESCLPSFDRTSTSSVTKTHVILEYDPKTHTAMDIEVSDPTPPFGAAFPPGPLGCVIKNWPPTKFFLVCGDGPSTDIGVIGSTSEGNWSHFTFEETSTPALPLGEGAEDLALLGLDIDFTNDKPVRVSEQADDDTPDLPPSPILYAYMSDGSVVGWHILFLDGTPFPGMVKSARAVKTSVTTTPSGSELQSSKSLPSLGDVPELPLNAPSKGFGAFSNQRPSSFGSTGTSSQVSPVASPPSSGFGKSAAPVFGVTGWGFGSKPSAPSFNSASFGNTNATSPVFGQTGFSSFASNTQKPGTATTGGGFSAFAQAKPSSFGALSGASKASIFDQSPESSAQPASAFGTASSAPKSVFALGDGSRTTSTESSKTASGFPAPTTGAFTSNKTTGSANSGFFGVKPADGSANGSFFGDKTFGAPKAPSPPVSSLGALDTMSTLDGSLKDAAIGSPPASPTMENSPINSPASETADLPKPTSSNVKPATAALSSAGPKPMSSFIKPGFGAFGFSSDSSTTFTSSTKPEAGFGKPPGTPQVHAASETQPTSSNLFASKQTQPVFGVSGFGTKPATPTFGASGFGQVSSTAVSSEPSKPSSGGFSAFATRGLTSFAKPAQPSSFDSLLRQGDLKPAKSPATFGTTSEPKLTSVSNVTPEPEKKEQNEDEKDQKPTSIPIAGTTDGKDSPSLVAPEEPIMAKDVSTPPKETPESVFEKSKPPKATVQQAELTKTEEMDKESPRIGSPPAPSKVTEVSKVREVPCEVVAPKPLTSSPAATSSNLINTIGTNRTPNLSPATAPPPPHAPAFGVGLGRPSSRPARSSPLASTPITLADEEVIAVSTPREGPSAPKTAPPSFPFPQADPFTWKSEISSGPKMSEISKQPLFGTPGHVPPASKPSTPVATPNLFSTTVTSGAEPVKPKEPQDVGMHPLQAEFIRTYEEFCRELTDLEGRLEALKALLPAIQVPRGLDKLVQNNEDFVPGKYSFGDLDPFKDLIFKLHEKVLSLLEEGKSDKLRLVELQNLALISETKKEELSRWLKAKEDPDFAKVMKSKSLGPEHTENQLRLRKLLQITLTRLQQCEDTMGALQKKLNQDKAGKTVFQAPTLDTIDRTCRNIKMALDERTEIVDRLSERVEAISSPRQESRRSDSSSNPPASSPAPSVTIAVAALNSERSCLSLKAALFNARQRPLFTEKVAKASPSAKPGPSNTTSIPSWTFSPSVNMDALATSAGLSGSGSISNNHDPLDRRRQNRKHTSIAVPLKNSTGQETKAPTMSFDWGPLPTIASTPAKKLPFEFKSSAKDPA